MRGVQVVDPRDCATPEFLRLYAAYPHIGPVLRAMGYGVAQIEELSATINASRAEAAIAATPVDLARLGGIERPVVRARCSDTDAGEPTLASLVLRLLRDRNRTG